ncbi:MAG: hypothetical protein Q8R08_03630 [bacterium]|nr:hypothetical protein [bacterium]
MTKEDIVYKVKTLNFPKDSYVVFGGSPLALVGIREANDIDLLVSPEVYSQLKKAGWQEVRKSENDIPLVRDVLKLTKIGILVCTVQRSSIYYQALL